MSNPFFRFKEFTVRHEGCAMKVGTDGSLLGAWTGIEKATRILDVGTGTGLIALMVAQRAPDATVDAIDRDQDAVRQALLNVSSSPFARRIRVHLASLADYRQRCTSGKKAFRPYDLIISNPPYFTRSLKSPEAARNSARHDDSLPLTSLLSDTCSLLSPGGRLSVILPPDRFELLRLQFGDYGFHLIRFMQVYPRTGVPPKRVLFELRYVGEESGHTGLRHQGAKRHSNEASDHAGEKTATAVAGSLVLEDAPGMRSEAYRMLMRDFYLTSS
jgi:tRNA1Val (adenine37-N6)-methyltransferase